MLEIFPFLSMFFALEDNIEIRTLKSETPAQTCYGKLGDKHLADFVEQHNRKRNIYFGANPRRDGVKGAACAADVKHRSAVYFDLDKKDGDYSATLQNLKAQRPHAIVMTGHGHHVWFRIQPEPPETNAVRLAEALGVHGSDAVGDAPRIARLPGTLNCKPGHMPVLAELTYSDHSAPVRPLSELLDVLGVPPESTSVKTISARSPAPSLDVWMQGLVYVSESWGHNLDYDSWLREGRALALVGAAAGQPWEPKAQIAFVSRDTETGGKHGLTFWKNNLKSACAGWTQVCKGNAALAFAAHPAPAPAAGAAVGPAPTQTANRFAAAMVQLGDVEPSLSTRYLVKGWLDAGTLSVVYGESNVGKSFLGLDIALHVAGGGCDWHGARLAENAGPVVYVAAEGGFGIRNRLAAFRKVNPEMAANAAHAFTLLPAAADLCGPGDIADLIDALPRRASLIVVDTLARSMGGGDENTAQDMGQFIRNVDRIRDATGAHVMVIHHSGKDTSKGARGSNSLRAAADTEIELTRGDSNVVAAETKKQRDMATDKKFAYRLIPVTLGFDEDGDQITSAVVEATALSVSKPKISNQQRVALEALDAAQKDYGGEPVPMTFWREKCIASGFSVGSADAKRKAFNRVKDALIAAGMIVVTDDMRAFRRPALSTMPAIAIGTGQDMGGTCPTLSADIPSGTDRTHPYRGVLP